jgi:hypothetical protein
MADNDELRHVVISRVGSGFARDGQTVFLVDFADGSAGTLSFPAAQGGTFIESIYQAHLSAHRASPELEALRIGVARDPNGKVILKIDTSQANAVFLALPPEQAASLRELLDRADRGSAPLLDDPKLN